MKMAIHWRNRLPSLRIRQHFSSSELSAFGLDVSDALTVMSESSTRFCSSAYFVLLLVSLAGYGFNPGSVLLISSEQAGSVAALVTINTTLGACAGAVSAMFLSTLMDIRQVGIAQW